MPRPAINLTKTSLRRLNAFFALLGGRRGFTDRQALVVALQMYYPDYWWAGTVPGEFKCLLEIVTGPAVGTGTPVTTLATVTLLAGQDSSGRDCFSLESIVLGDAEKPAGCKSIPLTL